MISKLFLQIRDDMIFVHIHCPPYARLYLITRLLDTVGQDIFADMILSRILLILTKPLKFHDSEQDVYDLISKKLY